MTILTIGNEQLSVSVNTKGAELWSVRTLPDGGEWLWQGDPQWWNGRAPILFPIVGRTFGNKVSFAGKQYEMGIHGFARPAEFAVVEQGADHVRLRLTDNAETRKQYPFGFQLDVVFALDGGTLTNRGEVRNPGKERMPVSFGFHPAFNWPLPGGAGKQHWLTLAEKEEPLTSRLGKDLMTAPGHNPSVFHDGRFAPAPKDFETDAIVIDTLKSRAITWGVVGGPSVAVTFADQESLGIWQKPGAPYICIEPWQGRTPVEGGSDALDQRPGAVWIGPGATRSFTLTVTPQRAG